MGAKKLKIYISGKMRGMDEEESRQLFSAAAEMFEEEGCKVINPWDIEDEKKKVCKDWGDFILYDLPILKECDAIVMLPNWKDSFGAQCEWAFASGMGIKVLYLNL